MKWSRRLLLLERFRPVAGSLALGEDRVGDASGSADSPFQRESQGLQMDNDIDRDDESVCKRKSFTKTWFQGPNL